VYVYVFLIAFFIHSYSFNKHVDRTQHYDKFKNLVIALPVVGVVQWQF